MHLSSECVQPQLNVSFHWYNSATESKRLPSCVMQVEGKQWTISCAFAVTIKSTGIMANAVMATCLSVCAMGSTSTCVDSTADPVRYGFRSGKEHRFLAPSSLPDTFLNLYDMSV